MPVAARGWATGILAAALAIAPACTGSGGGDEPQPLVRGLTTPVADLAALATPLPSPPGGFGADGPRGLAIIAADAGLDLEGELEDADVLVCDPSNDRVILVKARDRGTARARVFNQGALDEPRAVAVTSDRRVIATTPDGFAVLDAAGLALGAAREVRTAAGYVAAALTADGAALFLAGPLGIDRIALDADLVPQGAPVALASGVAVRALALAGSDLYFTAERSLRRIGQAPTRGAGASIEEVFTFAGCCIPDGLVFNSAGRPVVGVGVPAGGPHKHRLEEIELGPPARTHSLVHVPAAPRALAADGLRPSLAWTGAAGVNQQLHFAPELARHVFPIVERRGCASCHAPGTGVEPHDLDLTSVEHAHDSTFDVPSHCATGAGASLRVAEGSGTSSSLVEKLEGSGCGDRMLEGTRPLPAIEIDLIRGWIDAGGFLEGGSHGAHGAGH